MCPEEWRNKTLGDLIALQRGYDLPTQNRVKGKVPIMSGAGFAGYHNKANVDGPGIVIGRSGSGFGNIHYSRNNFWAHNTALFVKDFKGNDELFVYYYLSSLNFSTYNSGGVQPSLNRNFIYPIKVGIPPLPEQKKIAEILSTWDKAMTTTEKLLKNSQQQKKALMQQLLTGKKRLLDDNGIRFSGGWKEEKLGKISVIKTGSSNREDSNLDAEYTFFDRSMDIRRSSRYLFDTEAVIVAGEGQEFIPKHFIGKFDLHQRTYAIMDFKNVSGYFLYYYLTYYKNYFLSQAVGSTVKSLRLPMFQKMTIKYPCSKEQRKITTILSSTDREIVALKENLESLKQEKKALMQQLLTGKRRVKV